MGRFVSLSLCIALIACLTVVATAQQCGRQNRGRLCPNNLCCSQWGYCGNTAEYCSRSNGCQSRCRGVTDDNQSAFNSCLAAAPNVQCGRGADGVDCPNNLCCSQWGYCGTSSSYCSPSEGCQSNCRATTGISLPAPYE